MSILKGGSGSIVKKIGNKVIKYASTDQSLIKLKEQLDYLLKNKHNCFLPKILKWGGNYYVMPYYGESIFKKEKISFLRFLYKNIFSRIVKKNIDFSIIDYFYNKIYKLLVPGDIFPSNNYLEGLKDFKIKNYHGDITRENVLLNRNKFIFIDPNPSQYQSFGLEMGKFLFSFFYGYEELKEGGFPSSKYKKILKKYPYSSISHFYASTHFIRVLPYQNKKIFRDKYNEIMLEVLLKNYKNKKTYIFDFDGVLVNSDCVNMRSYNYAIERDVSKNYYKYKGLSYKKLIPLLVEDPFLSSSKLENIHNKKVAYYEEEVQFVKTNEFLLDFYIDRLINSEAIIYTCASKKCVEKVLNCKEIPYKKIFYVKDKKNLDIFNSIGRSKEDCIIIEDNLDNIEFYKKEGIDYIGVKS